MDGPLLRRFQAKVDVTASCWLWTGARTTGGYGLLKVDGRPEYVHRLSYEHHVGPIPDGLQLDHLCRVRCCVNPAHLEPVTGTENIRRGEPATRTHCPRGHDKLVHMRRDSRGKPYCLVCARAKSARQRQAVAKGDRS
jgi:hypothetical protein